MKGRVFLAKERKRTIEMAIRGSMRGKRKKKEKRRNGEKEYVEQNNVILDQNIIVLPLLFIAR